MKEKECKNRLYINKGFVLALLAAFLIPVTVVLIGFQKTGIYPFGTRSYLSIDGIHQYLPFFTELYNKLHQGESLFYSWSGGLGYDFWSVFSYYLASPLNSLIYFCKASSLNEGVTLVLLIKTGLSGLAMTAYLLAGKSGMAWKTEKNSPVLATAFGIMYGLSNYVIGYHINLMWMDCVILLPWLAAALERLVMQKKGVMYSFVLGLCIITNYFIGIAICLFSVIYYLMISISEKKFRGTAFRFGAYSLLGGAAAGLVLIPAVWQIMGTTAASTISSASYGVISDFFHIIGQMFTGTKAVMTTGEESLANIYCGVGAVLFVFFFLGMERIPMRVRIVYLSGLAILLASFCIGGLNLLFHGLHAGYGFPNRHAFLFVFLLLNMGYQGLTNLSKITSKHFYLAIAICFILVMITVLVEQPSQRVILSSVGILLVLLMWCIMYHQSGETSVFRRLATWGILITISGELAANALFSMKANGNTDRNYLMDRVSYVTEYLGQEESGEFYRADVVQNVSRNESLLYQQKGIALFSSTVSSKLVDALHNLGFYTSLNRIQYVGYSDAMNMLLGVRYTEKLNLLSSLNPYSPIRDSDIMIQNPHELSLGYMTKESVLEVSDSSDNPFANQNALLESMTGQALYHTEEILLDGHLTSSIIQKPGYHYYVYIKDNTIEDNGQSGESETGLTEAVLGSTTYYSDLNRIYDLGTVEDKQELEIQLKASKQAAVPQVYVGYYKESQLEVLYQILSAQQYEISEYHDSGVTGTVNCREKGVLFLSVPMSEGWTVTVDGEETKAFAVMDAFMGVPLDEGEHTITLKYHTKGWNLGVLCSILSILILVGTIIYEKNVRDKWKL